MKKALECEIIAQCTIAIRCWCN